MIEINVVLLVILFVCLMGYFYIKYRHGYWRKRKVPYLKPKNLFMGHTGDILLKKVPLMNFHEIIYNELSPHKFGGYYDFLTPTVLIRDPELIKNILTKDFDHFMDRDDLPLDESDPLALRLSYLQGQRWKNLRVKLTPTFTSGKIKNMYNFLKECTQDLMEVLDKTAQDNEPVEVRELMARFTTDVISSCAFGIQSNSQKGESSMFRIMGKRVFQSTLRSRIFGIVGFISPKIKRLLKLTTYGKEVEEFFKSVVTSTMQYRGENKVCRNDFIDLLISLKKEESLNSNANKEKKMELTDNLLTALCFSFFIAGFETSSGTLTLALYELAKHPEIQETLFNEIFTATEECDEELTYDSVQNMPYLDRVISETLRMYPVLSFLTRVCNKNYQLTPEVIVEKKTRVTIPVRGLHYDPQHFQNPYEFNPENFSKEAKAQRHHYCYLPFGEGPRICMGMRFGLTQVKLGLATIIKNYSVSLSSKMNGPLSFNRSSLILRVDDGGVWLTFNRRISS